MRQRNRSLMIVVLMVLLTLLLFGLWTRGAAMRDVGSAVHASALGADTDSGNGGQDTGGDIDERDATSEEASGQDSVPPGRILGKSVGTALVLGSGEAGSAGGRVSLKAVQNVGSECLITPKENYYYGSYETCRFEVSTGGHKFTGYCAQPLKKTPEGTFPVSELKNETVKFLIMCGPGGPFYNQYGKTLFKKGDNDNFADAHACIGYVYSGSLYGLSGTLDDEIKQMVANAKEMMKGEAIQKEMKKFTAYVAYNSLQDIVWVAQTAPDAGFLKLTKKGAESELTKGNSFYSLTGAQYGVYQESGCTNKAGTLTTQADGTTNQLELEVGTYYVREDKAPAGYRLDATVHKAVIQEEKTTTLAVTDKPQYAVIDLAVIKADRERAASEPVGGATLAGAQFLVEYYAAAQAGDLSTRRWILQSDEDGACPMDAAHKLEGDDFYRDSQGRIVLPLGTVVISEVKAPRGYLVNDKKVTLRLTDDSGGKKEIVYEAPVIEDQVIRGDLELNKISEDDQHRLPGVPFKITSQTSGESHIIVADENGYFSTASDWNPHSQNTNEGATAEDGIWFGEGEPDDVLGALPYDTYTVEEQPCAANAGYRLISFEVSITRDGKVVSGGTVSNKKDPVPAIGTRAYDGETGRSELAPDKAVTIIDEVHYEGLDTGKEYTLVGTLMDKASGEPLIVGEQVATADQTFTPQTKEGSEAVTFKLDATTLAGKETVVFEKLYNDAGVEVASHEDLQSERQTVRFKEKQKTTKKAAKKLTTPGKKARTTKVRTGDLMDPIDWLLIVLIMGFFAASRGAVLLPRKA